MALGFKKPAVSLGDIGMLGGLGIAALGGPAAPLILASLYSAQEGAAEEDAKKRQREEDVQKFINREGGAGYDPNTDVIWNQARPGFEAEQRARLGRIAPEFMVKQAAAQMFPEPEAYGEAKEVVGPDGKPAFAAFGSRGGVRQFGGVQPPAKQEAVGARGWFSDGRSVFQAYENAPGTRAAVQSGKWRLAQDPKSAAEGVTPVQIYERNFGKLGDAMMPEVQNGQITGRQVPQVGGAKDPAVIEQNRAAALATEAPGAKAALDTTTQFYDNVLNTIERIKNNPNTRDVVGAWEGRGEPWGLNPFTAQGNASAFTDIDNLQNMLQVQGLQVMRDASKTGGAVGSVTEKEWPKLSARFGNLDRRQGEAAFLKNLDNIANDFRESKKRIQDTYANTYGGQAMANVPDAAVAALRANPTLWAQFEEKYGPGSAKRYLNPAAMKKR